MPECVPALRQSSSFCICQEHNAPQPARKDTLTRIDFADGTNALSRAQALLNARECFIMRNHELWPAATERWGDPECTYPPSWREYP